jgi:hypothetical protein
LAADRSRRYFETAAELATQVDVAAVDAAVEGVVWSVRSLAWGFTAAIVGTITANAFYLTMQFYYFYALMALALAVPVVFAGRE